MLKKLKKFFKILGKYFYNVKIKFPTLIKRNFLSNKTSLWFINLLSKI